MTRLVFHWLILLGTIGMVNAAEPERWPNWRGPHSNGVAPAGNYATEWSAEKNLDWQVELAGRGASTPAVLEDRLFVSSSSPEENFLQAFDLKGAQLWKEQIGQARTGKHAKASGSNSSPVTDGKNVFAYYKSGDLACYSKDGKKVWHVNLQKTYGEDTLWWDLGTSPVLTSKALVIAVMQSGPSYLLALDPATGEKLWQADRVMPAPNEANQSYSTPIVATVGGQEVLLTLGADHLTCHAAADGKLLWKLGGFNPEQQQFFRSIASPVLVGDLIICPYARGKSVTAVKLAIELEEKDRIAWQLKEIGSDVPTPLVSDGRLYVVGDKGSLWCLKAVTGEVIWQENLPKSRLAYSSSPVLADGRVYITREDSTTFVIADAPEFKLLATNSLEGSTVATPVFVGGKIYFRTYDKLYCIGNVRSKE